MSSGDDFTNKWWWCHQQEERQLSFVRESLELIFDLYRTNNTYPATWEKNTIQHFLISLERLMDTLDQCVSNKYQCVTNEYNSTV